MIRSISTEPTPMDTDIQTNLCSCNQRIATLILIGIR